MALRGFNPGGRIISYQNGSGHSITGGIGEGETEPSGGTYVFLGSFDIDDPESGIPAGTYDIYRNDMGTPDDPDDDEFAIMDEDGNFIDIGWGPWAE